MGGGSWVPFGEEMGGGSWVPLGEEMGEGPGSLLVRAMGYGSPGCVSLGLKMASLPALPDPSLIRSHSSVT